MSLSRRATLSCPDCDASLEFELAASVNGGRQPEQRAAILEGRFQVADCGCGARVSVAPADLHYVDFERGHWMMVQPFEALHRWPEHAAACEQAFASAFGDGAPEVARELGEGLSPRLAFGLPALREKLLLTEQGVDDAVVECMKLQLMKQQGIIPQAGHDLRFTGLRDESWVFEVIKVDEGRVVDGYGVPRALYDEIAGDRGPWQPILSQLQPPFVDIQRLFYGPE